MTGRRIRVLHFLTEDALAGTELSSYELVRAIDRQRFDIEVAFLVGGGPVSDLLLQEGIKVHSLVGSGSLMEGVRGLLRLVRSNRFDVVHLFGFKTGILGRLVFRTLAPSSVVIHGIRGQHVTQAIATDSFATRLALGVERLLSPLVDYYVANSRGAIRFLTQIGLPAKKFVWIASGIDLASWPNSPREAKSTPLIACVARFVPVKQHGDLVEALERVSREGLPFKCVLAGGGPLRMDTQAKSDALGLQGAISYPGELDRDEVRSLLTEADMFVLASAWEGQPRSVMEAMAAGLPIVATNVNGINELVVDGETGLLVPPGDTAAMASAIAKLLRDQEIRLEMGRRGRLRIEAEYDIRSTTNRLETFYGRVASQQFRKAPLM
ncbi:MAG: glycosyltransferase [Anaerolineales bacterium]